MQGEEVGNELAAIGAAQEGRQHGSPDHEGLHILNAFCFVCCSCWNFFCW